MTEEIVMVAQLLARGEEDRLAVIQNDVNFHSFLLFIGDVDGEDDGAVRVKSDDNGF